MPLIPREEEWDLPLLKQTLLLKPEDQYWLYDVKFYPFTATGNSPVFAVVSIHHVLVYRICWLGGGEIQLIQRIEDDEKSTGNSSLAWSKDLKTGAPLLCFGGGNAKIKIIDVQTGDIRATLIGHGGDINDLVISPLNPQILASASADNTVRIWSLDPAHSKEPCVALCAGQGHLDTVLSVAFHANGQYILSGGQDNIVNLWMLPKTLGVGTGEQRPKMIYFPHFSTSEIHSNIVDCVKFHGDLILSKAFGEHCIVLWMITGFDSASPLPASTSAPTNSNNQFGTRSAFSKPPGSPGESYQYMRLLQFHVPSCDRFYMRFSLFSCPDRHSILAICNSRGKIFFWDLSRLTEYHKFTTTHNEPEKVGYGSNLPTWLASQLAKAMIEGPDSRNIIQPSASVKARPSLHVPSTGSFGENLPCPATPKKKYSMADPQGMVEAHATVSERHKGFEGRQVAWTSCGRWCVVVGTPNVIAVLERLGKAERKRGKGVD